MTLCVQRGSRQSQKQGACFLPHDAIARAMHRKAQGHWPSRAEGTWSPGSTGVWKGTAPTWKGRVCNWTTCASLRRRHPQPPLQEPGSTSRKGPTTTRPTKAGAGRCFSSRSPASPRCKANTQATSCELPLAAAGRQTQLPTCADAVAEHLGATEHVAIGHLFLHASTAIHGGMRLYHIRVGQGTTKQRRANS